MGIKYAERKKVILSALKTNEKVEVTNLVKELGVSGVTVRRDLCDMEKEGLLIKTYGGAVRLEPNVLESVYRDKIKQMPREKEMIGKYAATLIKERDIVFLDSGTTTSQIARHLTSRRGVTVITNSLFVLSEFRSDSDIGIVLLGGNYRVGQLDLNGPVTEQNLEDFHATKAFLGTDGVSAEGGVTTGDMHTLRITRLMARSADEVIVLCDKSKIGISSLSKYAGINEINKLITNKGADAKCLAKIRRAGVEVITV